MSDNQPKKEKIVRQSQPNVDVADAWKSCCFAARSAICVASGRVIGDWKVDDSLGRALAEMYPPKELAKQGTGWAIALAAAAGAWQAIRRS